MIPQCCGVTNKGQRCSNKGRYIQFISDAEFNVCKHHQKINLLSKWDSLKLRPKQMPVVIRAWLENFYDAWGHTQNLAVSAKYASAVFKTTDPSHGFDIKYETYINSLVKDETTEPCSVCYGEEDVKKTKCHHSICMDCTAAWMTRSITCPVCRNIL